MEIFLLVAVLIIGGYVLLTYNSLKTLQVRIKASIQEIGNQLKRQAELIPNLESSAKGYLKHEKDIFDKLTDARKAISSNKIEKSQELISKALGALQVVVESNPEIKGSTVVTDLMSELRDTGDKLMYARRTMIDLSADYNAAIVTFPNSLLTNLFSFKPQKGLEITEKESQNPIIKL